MAPAQRQAYVSISLGSWVLTRQNFHLSLFTLLIQNVCITIVPLSLLLKVLWRRDMLFPLFYFPHGLSALHPNLSLTFSSAPINGWNLFINKSNHRQDQGLHTLHLANVIAWLVGGKKRTFSICSVFKLRIEKVTLYSQ